MSEGTPEQETSEALLSASRIPPALSALLWPFSLPYRAVVTSKRRCAKARATKLDVPVVSVGNLTCGGTGKTPTVECVVRDLLELGHRPAILSRGYGAEDGAESVNDEFRVLAENLDGVPHFAGADRIANGRRAISEGADVLVLDDGFQHVRLARDLDIVLLDALNPFDNGRLLPAGLLREPKSALRDAGLVAISRTELVGEESVAAIEREVARVAADVPIARLALAATEWCDVRGDGAVALDELRGTRAVHFAAVGNPRSFDLAIDAQGVESSRAVEFPDHHNFTPGDIARVSEAAKRAGVETVLCTQKDAVKLRGDDFEASMANLRWLWLRVEQQVTGGMDDYSAALERLHN